MLLEVSRMTREESKPYLRQMCKEAVESLVKINKLPSSTFKYPVGHIRYQSAPREI
mgnify:CR=1 FL=1